MLAVAVEKFAVTALSAVMVNCCGLLLPVSAPLHPEKVYPALLLAVSVTTAPCAYFPLAPGPGFGATVPPAAGFVAIVKL